MKKSRKILAFALSLSMLTTTALPTLMAGAEQSISASDTLNHGVYVEYYEVEPNAPYDLITSDVKNTGFAQTIDFSDMNSLGLEMVGRNIYYGARLHFYIIPTESGQYVFNPDADDYVRMWINGNQIIQNGWGGNYLPNRPSKPIYLEAGEKYEIQLDYAQATGGAGLTLYWSKDGAKKTVVPADVLYLPEGMGPVEFPEIPEVGTGKIYTIATAHLDTIWNWSYETTIGDYIPKTMRENFQLFEDNPNYVFSFEGARRYALMEEYYPEEFEQLEEYVAEGRWNTAGSSWENGDQNGPSPESLIRNALLGNQYFADKFGNDKRSKDIYLPDCFGFGYAMPSWMSHMNLLSFSTQKLTWGNAFPNEQLPFDIGKWVGPDGNYVMASIDNGSYTNKLNDLAPNGLRENSWVSGKLKKNKAWGFYATTLYHGTGDTGGSPGQNSVTALNKDMALNGTDAGGDVEVISATTDQWVREMTQAQKDAAPVYDGEMLLREHGTGSYTSRALGHRWNSRNELLGVAAEKSAVAASWLGAEEYPIDQFNTAWKRVIGHQFHDDITGTSFASEYVRSWNDYMLSLNQFGNEYENAVGGVASAMDTSVAQGTALVVNNPVAVDRNDLVEATVTMDSDCEAVRVFDDEGNEVASQILSKDGNVFDIVFKADVPSMGYRVFDVRPADSACDIDTGLSVTSDTLSNEKYDVVIDANGDIHSIYDKELGKELLAEPIRLGQLNDTETEWPSWELKFDDYAFKDAREYVTADKASKFEVVENGPARVAIKITREYGNSTYEQIVSLEAGGEAVEVQNVIDWHEKSTMLKATFQFTAADDKATYDLGLGAIERTNNTKWQAESPAQKWADLTDKSGDFGVSILSDSKNGWDKPHDDTLRLTLIHTPTGAYLSESHQNNLEQGENRFGFAIYGHEGAYGEGGTQQQAQLFTEPMVAFQTVKHEGGLGSNYSFASISNDDVIVRAVKAGETGEGLENQGDEIIVRFNEGAKKDASGVEFSIGNGIESVREVYGSEEAMPEEVSAEQGAYELKDGKLVFDISAYGIRTFAIKLKDSDVQASKDAAQSIALPYNKDIYSSNSNKADSTMNAKREAFPSELVPSVVTAAGVDFVMGSMTDGTDNAVVANGQTIAIPEGYNKLHLLAFSTNGDHEATFKVGDSSQTISIADYSENIAEWEIAPIVTSSYIKEDDVAFEATHRHANGGDQIAVNTYMFQYELDIPEGATSVVLPEDNTIFIAAATAVNEQAPGSIVSEMYDSKERSEEETEVTGQFEGYSGFEADDPVPYKSQTGNCVKIDNAKCEVVADENAHSGSNVVRLTGTDTVSQSGIGISHVYFDLYPASGFTIQPGTYIEYWIKPNNEISRHAGLDIGTDDYEASYNATMRDNGKCVDQNGTQMHPKNARGKVGEWTRIRCDIGKYFKPGTKVTSLWFVYDNPEGQGEIDVSVDDIFIGIDKTKEDLQSLVNEVHSLNRDDYYENGFVNVDKVMKRAEDALANETTTNQMFSIIYDKLQKAVDQLVPKVADKSPLIALMEEVSAIDRTLYTEESLAILDKAIAKGQKVLDNAYASPDDVTIAIEDLNNAVGTLEELPEFYATTDKEKYEVNETITATITTPKDVRGLSLRNENGKYVSIQTISSRISDDKKIWTVTFSVGSNGARSLDIWGNVAGSGWTDTGINIDFQVGEIKPVDPGDSLPRQIFSLDFEESVVGINETVHATVTSTTALDRLVLLNENGKFVSISNVAYTDKKDVRTWTFEFSVGSAGFRDLTVKGYRGDSSAENTVSQALVVTK
nr:glycoside hydrolase family 38 C-terminal domain-containing protein [uncultured Solibaculum sp.]